MSGQTRVFISAASAEFRPLRERLAAMLQRSGINVEYQEIFPQTAADTVRKLGDLIKDCPLLVHIVGHSPGSIAAPGAVTDLLKSFPKEQFLSRFPDLRQRLGNFSGITYTQWEAFLALHIDVPMLVYAPLDACEPDAQRFKDSFAQKEHLERLILARKYPECCEDESDYVGKILADVHRHFGITPAEVKPQNLPYPSLGTLFKGRDEFLAQLRTRLAKEKATVIKGRQAIHGMGGVGKTRAAVEYAWEHADDYTALLFVTADSPESLERNLAAICDQLVLNLAEQDARETDVQVAAVLRWLNQNPGWFLIIDNVDTPEAQRAVSALLGAIPEGHVVITSRLADWPAGVAAHDLDVLDEESSIAFLLERTDERRIRRDDDLETAAQIARMLDGLALALEQCAAYVRHRRCTLASYVKDWESKRAAVLAWHDPVKSNYGLSLAVTFDTSVAELSEDARQLFHILSWLAPDPIPMFAIEHLKVIPDPRASVIELTDFHLARLSPDGTRVTIHRLLQEITRQQQRIEDSLGVWGWICRLFAKPLGRPDRLKHLRAALDWLSAEMLGDTQDVTTWPVAAPLVTHAVTVAIFACCGQIANASANFLKQASGLLNQAACLLMAQANYKAAEPLLRSALSLNKIGYSEDDPSIATSFGNLAGLLMETNRLSEAEPLIRRALAINEGKYGSEHPYVANNLHNLAQLLAQTSRPDEAELVMRRSLSINEAHCERNSPRIARDLANLAVLLQNSNRFGEAEELARRALTISEASRIKDHPALAGDLNNLATVLCMTNRADEAEPLMRRALEIFERNLGKTHPKVSTLLNNLAQLLSETNRHVEAEQFLIRAIAADEAISGKEHPKVATDLNNLALSLKASNRISEAEPLMRRALEILLKFTRNTGHEHPKLRGAIENYGNVLKATGRTNAQVVEQLRELISEHGVSIPSGGK